MWKQYSQTGLITRMEPKFWLYTVNVCQCVSFRKKYKSTRRRRAHTCTTGAGMVKPEINVSQHLSWVSREKSRWKMQNKNRPLFLSQVPLKSGLTIIRPVSAKYSTYPLSDRKENNQKYSLTAWRYKLQRIQGKHQNQQYGTVWRYQSTINLYDSDLWSFLWLEQK